MKSLLRQHTFLQTESGSFLTGEDFGWILYTALTAMKTAWMISEEKTCYSPSIYCRKRMQDSSSGRLLRLVVNQSITSKAICSQTAAELHHKSDVNPL